MRRTSCLFGPLSALVSLLLTCGCHSVGEPGLREVQVDPDVIAAAPPMPRELSKAILPRYVIESPDLLAIEAIHIVPKQPYHLRAFDVLAIQVSGTPAEVAD